MYFFWRIAFLLSDKNDPQATIWRIYIDKSAAGHVDIIGEIPDTLFITLKLHPVCLRIYVVDYPTLSGGFELALNAIPMLYFMF